MKKNKDKNMKKNESKFEKISIDKIFLSNNNPRFKTLYLQNFTIDNFKMKQKNNDLDCAKKIFQLEGDLKDFVNISKSIEEKGFDSAFGKVIVIENDNNEYIIIEGNRRVLALKLLLQQIGNKKKNKINENKIFDFVSKNQIDDSIQYKAETDEDNYENLNDTKKINEKLKTNLKNLKKIWNSDKLTKNFKKNNNKIDCQIIYNDKDLKKVLFSNHMIGDTIGKRNWDRGKLLLLYYNFWNSEYLLKLESENIEIENTKNNFKKLNEKKIENLSNIFNRDKKQIISNLTSSLFIVDLINIGYKNENKNDIIKKYEFFSKKYTVSALEKQFITKFFNFVKEKIFDEYFKFEIVDKDNNKYKKEIISKCFIGNSKTEHCIKNKHLHNEPWISLSKEEIYKFIIECYELGYFTTRGIAEKHKNIESKIYKKIVNFLSYEVELNEETTFEDIRECSLFQVEAFIDDGKNKFSDKYAYKIVNSLIELKNFLKDKKTINLFDNIFKKIKKFESKIFLTCIKEIFLNLKEIMKEKVINRKKIKNLPFFNIASTIRSFLENISYLLFYYNTPKFFNENKEFNYDDFFINFVIQNIKKNKKPSEKQLEKLNQLKSLTIKELLWLKKKDKNKNLIECQKIYQIYRIFFNPSVEQKKNYEKFLNTQNKFKEEIKKLFKNNNWNIENENLLNTIFNKEKFNELSKLIHSTHILYKNTNSSNIDIDATKQKQTLSIISDLINDILKIFKIFN